MDAQVLLHLLLVGIDKTTVSFEMDGKELILDHIVPDCDDEYHITLAFKLASDPFDDSDDLWTD